MSKFVFRNYTVEPFFDKGDAFSGYDDISDVPKDMDCCVWFYQQPLGVEVETAVEEIGNFVQKLQFVMLHLQPTTTMVALTMERLYDTPLSEDDRRMRFAISSYNEALFSLAGEHANLKVIDLSDFCHRYPSIELIDWRFFFMSQMALSPKLAKDFKVWLAHKLEGVALKRKKCIVLDLDNTLWGGVLGEEGPEGIQIGGDYPGKAFLLFQKALIRLGESGVILAVCSKNNEQDVLDVWEKNPFLALKREHFATWRINWTDKATNIREMAEELNLGMDSFVFVDDNPVEREFVKQQLPMVEVPEFPEHPYDLPVFFKRLVDDYFKMYSFTDEDRQKTRQYKARAMRLQEQRGFSDLKEFLRGLDIQMIIEQANEFNIQRIAQLTQKTNQFNLTTRRYTDANIRKFLKEGWRIWCLSTADKYGDEGITGCAMVNGEEIDTLLLSCRVLGKVIEHAFLKTVLSQLKAEGVRAVSASYYPTLKNKQVSDFYEKNGFSISSEESDGTIHYSLELSNADFTIDDYYHITIKQTI